MKRMVEVAYNAIPTISFQLNSHEVISALMSFEPSLKKSWPKPPRSAQKSTSPMSASFCMVLLPRA